MLGIVGTTISLYAIHYGSKESAINRVNEIKGKIDSTQTNLIEEFNNLDSIGRAKFIDNANLNKDEIIVQINNQTVQSASEIIGEVQGKFKVIERKVQTNTKNIVPRKVSDDQKSLKLKEFLKLIPNSNPTEHYGIYEYITYNYFDKEQLPLLKELLELSKKYSQGFHPDGDLEYFFLIIIFRDFPDEIFDNKELYEEYTQQSLTKIMNSGRKSEIVKRGIKKNVEKLYENGNFITQGYFKDINSFCQQLDSSQELSDFTYQLVKSREEKFYLYKKYYLNHLKSQPNKKYYWGKSLKNEFGEKLTNEEENLLKNIK